MASPQETQVNTLADDRIEIIPAEGLVLVEGEPAPEIRGKKFEVLRLLAERADSTVTLHEACREIWGDHDLRAEARLRVNISQVRKHLGEELGDEKHGAIKTKSGVGYRARTSLTDTEVQYEEDDSSLRLIADDRVGVDMAGLSVIRDSHVIEDITPTEFKLLAELARRPDRIIGYETLISTIWGYVDKSALQTGQVVMSTLRKKLGAELGDAKTGALRTRYDVGYYAVSSLQR